MKKDLFVGIFFAICTLFISTIYADTIPLLQQQIFLSGKMLIVDMDNDGKISKDNVMNGTDVLLGTISNNRTLKAPAFRIASINDIASLAQFDNNHNGVIKQKELASSNLVLIRFALDRSITIIPLAISNIKEIHYQKGIINENHPNQALTVWLTSVDGKKFQTYYLNF